MIPVQPQPEPGDFSERVRSPGTAFLKEVPRPATRQWDKKEYWREVLPDMRDAYNGVCAYSAHWISRVTGGHSIDHFLPRSLRPDLAYEWTNYRYASAKLNSRKGTRSILDPFRLEPGWFTLDFESYLVRPNPRLAPERKSEVQHTIDVLRLNDDEGCVEERQEYIECFCSGEISFAHLERMSPFIAYELRRQGLISRVVQVVD